MEKLEIKWFNFEDIEKWIIGTSCIYIKPIRRNLDLETSHALLIQTPNWPKKPRSVHKKFSNIATLAGHNSRTAHWNSFIITASIIIESKNFWVYGHFKHFLKCLKGTFYCLKCLKGTLWCLNGHFLQPNKMGCKYNSFGDIRNHYCVECKLFNCFFNKFLGEKVACNFSD